MKNDTKIFEDVCEKLKYTPLLDSSGINVAVKDGIVTLSGAVNKYSEKYLAEDSAKSVVGVRGVVDELEVKLPGDRKITDHELAHSITNTLEWDSLVPSESIQVIVDKGFVTLTGEVGSMLEKQRATTCIRQIEGIKNISNLISVRDKIQASEVKEKIKDEFERNALLDANKVQVEVDGNKVTLRGHVRSWAEYNEASAAAWSVPGVDIVNNLLHVDLQ